MIDPGNDHTESITQDYFLFLCKFVVFPMNILTGVLCNTLHTCSVSAEVTTLFAS